MHRLPRVTVWTLGHFSFASRLDAPGDGGQGRMHRTVQGIESQTRQSWVHVGDEFQQDRQY